MSASWAFQAAPNQVVNVTIKHGFWKRLKVLLGYPSTVTLRYDERGNIVDILFA